MKNKKQFSISIDFEPIELHILAKNKREAKKKAIEKLKAKSSFSVVNKEFNTHKKSIYVDEI